MNRIDGIFKAKPKSILSVYLTAGYPGLEDTLPLIREMEKAGVDMIEIGMPFSDPLADGPVLQACNQKALKNGMSLGKLFRQLKDVRRDVNIPLILMGYLNPVLNYGIEAFCNKAAEIGIDGVILPDLPVEEYDIKYRKIFIDEGLHMIFLVTPQTSKERMRRIATASAGFIYMVSSASTTGVKKGFQQDQIDYFKRVKEMDLGIPGLIGFGISDREDFRTASEYANGAIIGSAFMKHISTDGKLSEKVSAFVESIQ
jgi:tryptophan synthase alpha chain